MKVALTFDDGPVRGGTEHVLDVLGRFGVQGTFFCLGANTLLNPRIIERTVAEGHVVGNHSMHHSRLDGISPRDRSHFLESETALRDVLGRAPRLYRSPWGWSSPWEVRRLRRHGLELIGWDINSQDWRDPPPSGEWIGRRAVNAARPGSIFLFHDGATHAIAREMPATAEALRVLIPALRDRGFQFVTVADLLGLHSFKDQ